MKISVAVDHVDVVLGQWQTERPDLDVSPMAVIGRLSIASRLIDAHLSRTFAAHGLDAASFDVLATLRRAGPPYQLSPTQLTRAAMITTGAVSQRLDRLEARSLVTREPSSSDGRGVQVTLTPAGRDLIDQTLPDHLQTEHRLLAALSPRQRAVLAETLQQLLRSIGDVG